MSNVCIACIPEYRRARIVNMIGVCLDTTITTSHCDRYTFRPLRFRPCAGGCLFAVPGERHRQEVAHPVCRLRLGPVDARRLQGRHRGARRRMWWAPPASHSVPADMVPFLSKIRGDFDGLFMIFFGKDGVNVVTQAYNLGLHNKYRFAGDGAAVVAGTNLPAQREKALGFVGHRPLSADLRGAAGYRPPQKVLQCRVRAFQGNTTRMASSPTATASPISKP